MKYFLPPAAQRSGFSLLELLVAMAVLSLILVLLFNAVTAVTNTWRRGMARIDNFSKARAVLGLLDRDVQSMVLRKDLAAFVDEAGKPACAFYSLMNGSEGDRRLSFIKYSVPTNGTQLLRADYGMDYGNRTLSLNNTNSLPDAALASPQDLVDGILRFEWQFLGPDGDFQSAFERSGTNASANSKTLVVSLLVLDDNTLGTLQRTGTRDTLLTELAGTPASGQTYAQYWNERIRSAGFGSSLPAPVRAGIRTFHRHIQIP